MTKEMRLIDAEALAEKVRACRGTAERKADARAVKMLDWMLSVIDEEPGITVQAVPAASPAKKKAKKSEPKHKYGKYSNVLLSDAELDKLREEFPHDWEARIEAVSDYAAASGKKYKNYLAVIRNWARRDDEEKNAAGAAETSFETDEFLELAKNRTYGGDLK